MKNFLLFLSLIFLFSGSYSQGESTFRVPLGVNLQTLDPSEAEDFVTIRVLMNLGEGLVRLNGDLEPKPGLASSWKISSDKKTYTFSLKKSQWSDGKALTADDFVRGFEHTFSPKTASLIAAPILEVIRGAQDYKSSKVSDFKTTGVRALNINTLEIKLTHPAPYFLSLLALPLCFPKHDNNQSKIAPDSPSVGPYLLKDLKTEKIVLVPNPSSNEKAQNNLEFIFVKEEGTAVSLYEKGELDLIDRVPSGDFERLKNSPELVKAPWLATYYLGFNQIKAPFNSVEARRFFVEAIDREAILKVLRDPQKAASSWVPAPLATSNLSYGPRYNPKEAKEKWDKLSKLKSLDYVFDSQEKNTLIAIRLQDLLKKNLNLDLNLRGFEWKSYLQHLKTASPVFFRFAWLAAFPDPLSHLGVFTSTNPNNYTGYKNLEYDKLVKKIGETGNLKLRYKWIKQAQDMLLTKDVVIMPLFNYVQYLLVSRRWQGLEVTPMGILYFHQVHRVSAP